MTSHTLQHTRHTSFSSDKRKRRRQHRVAAREMLAGGSLLNATSRPGSTLHSVAMWHLSQARSL